MIYSVFMIGTQVHVKRFCTAETPCRATELVRLEIAVVGGVALADAVGGVASTNGTCVLLVGACALGAGTADCGTGGAGCICTTGCCCAATGGGDELRPNAAEILPMTNPSDCARSGVRMYVRINMIAPTTTSPATATITYVVV